MKLLIFFAFCLKTSTVATESPAYNPNPINSKTNPKPNPTDPINSPLPTNPNLSWTFSQKIPSLCELGKEHKFNFRFSGYAVMGLVSVTASILGRKVDRLCVHWALPFTWRRPSSNPTINTQYRFTIDIDRWSTQYRYQRCAIRDARRGMVCRHTVIRSADLPAWFHDGMLATPGPRTYTLW